MDRLSQLDMSTWSRDAFHFIDYCTDIRFVVKCAETNNEVKGLIGDPHQAGAQWFDV